MPGNKKKTKQTESGKTKAMKTEEDLPPFSASTTLCFPPARPKGCTEPMCVHRKSLGGYLIYGCHCPLTSITVAVIEHHPMPRVR